MIFNSKDSKSVLIFSAASVVGELLAVLWFSPDFKLKNVSWAHAAETGGLFILICCARKLQA
jgi:hypothetical protein